MLRIGIRIQEADCDGFHLLADQHPEALFEILLGQGSNHLSGGIDALRDFQSQEARHEGARFSVQGVVHLGSVASPDLEDVPKTPARYERRLGSFTLDQCVDDDRCSVREERNVSQRDRELLDRFDRADRRVEGRRRDLADHDAPRSLVE